MRIPTDIRLEDWIWQLIRDGQIVKFYKSDDWTELRLDVLTEQHYECQRCLEHGAYTRAEMVHHVNEVRKVPRLALSKFYIDKDGKKQKNLLALCNKCHEIIHDRANTSPHKAAKRFTNEERW